MRIPRKVKVAMWAVLLGLGARAAVAAEPLAPRRASDIVTLRSSGAVCASAAFSRLFDLRVLRDGTTEPFSLPPEGVLVITGIDWLVGGAPADSQIELILYVEADPAPLIPLLADRGDSIGTQVIRSTTTSPIVAKGPLCAVSNTTVDFVSGVVHGFLAPDR